MSETSYLGAITCMNMQYDDADNYMYVESVREGQNIT